MALASKKSVPTTTVVPYEKNLNLKKDLVEFDLEFDGEESNC